MKDYRSDFVVPQQLDEDPSVRKEGFFEAKVFELAKRVADLEYDNAELSLLNGELSDRVEKLASKPPSWPKGYRPHKNNRNQSSVQVLTRNKLTHNQRY